MLNSCQPNCIGCCLRTVLVGACRWRHTSLFQWPGSILPLLCCVGEMEVDVHVYVRVYEYRYSELIDVRIPGAFGWLLDVVGPSSFAAMGRWTDNDQ